MLIRNLLSDVQSFGVSCVEEYECCKRGEVCEVTDPVEEDGEGTLRLEESSATSP